MRKKNKKITDEKEELSQIPAVKTRRCSICGQVKPDTEFNYLQKEQDKRMYICKDCEHDAKRATREHKRNIMEQLKTIGCACCGETDNVCLDFHHYDPTEKEFNMSSALTKPVDKLIHEAAKCVVVCSNCHRKIHAGTLNIEDYVSRHEYEYRKKLIHNTFFECNHKTNSKK